jgi:hypothetical protein
MDGRHEKDAFGWISNHGRTGPVGTRLSPVSPKMLPVQMSLMESGCARMR